MSTRETFIDKRKQKFSKEAIEKIRNDFLQDASLLSRQQNSDNFSKLLTSQSAREKLLMEIKTCSNTDLIEHGLRKLREVIVSLWDSKETDPSFIKFAQNVYVESYKFSLGANKLNMVGNIVLQFLIEKLPQFAKEKGFLTVYIIYISHIEMDMNKAISLMLKYDYLKETLLILITSYCFNKTKPDEWFQVLVDSYIDDKLVVEFLEAAGKITELQERCLGACKKSYNQLSLSAFSELWLHRYPLSKAVEQQMIELYGLQTANEGSKILYFKKRK